MTNEEQLTAAEREKLHYLHGYHFIPAYEGERRNLEPTADLVASAAWLVIWLQFGSPSMLTRRLGLTFGSASKLVHELQRWDVLGRKPNGHHQHPVLYDQTAAHEVHKQITGLWRPES